MRQNVSCFIGKRSEVSKRGCGHRGWHEEILPMPEIAFLHPFSSYSPLGEGEHISGELFGAVFGGLLIATSRQPFSKPLKRGTFQNASKISQKRGNTLWGRTPFGRYRFSRIVEVFSRRLFLKDFGTATAFSSFLILGFLK